MEEDEREIEVPQPDADDKPEELAYFETTLSLKDTFVIVFQMQDDERDFLGEVIEITDTTLQLIDENKNTELLELSSDKHILMKTNEYEIIDIEKIEKVSLNDIQDELVVQTVDVMYPEITIETDILNTSDYQFTDAEKKESFLSDLIGSYKVYDNDYIFKELSIIANHMIKIIHSLPEEVDYSDTFPEIMRFSQSNTLPSWIVPISDSLKKLYVDNIGQPGISVQNPNIITDTSYNTVFEYELANYYNQSDTLSYKQSIQKHLSEQYLPTIIRNQTAYRFPYSGEFLLDESYESFHTQEPFVQPTIVNRVSLREIVVPPQDIQLSRLLIFNQSHSKYNYKKLIGDEYFSIQELSELDSLNYNPRSSKEVFQELQRTNSIQEASQEFMFGESAATIYTLPNNITRDTLVQYLKQNLPKTTDIFNQIPKDILQHVYNYTDMIRLYIHYPLHMSEIPSSLKQLFNEVISQNMQNVQTISKPMVLTMKPLTMDEKIDFIFGYLKNIKSIPIKNFYYTKIIEQYTRNANKPGEDPNRLYRKDNDTPILCKHYLYSTKIDKDPLACDCLKTIFGTEPINGIIYCKVCNEQIDVEDFSLVEGFEDNRPVQTKEVMQTEEINIFLNITKKQEEIKQCIDTICINIGVTLLDEDTYELIQLTELIQNDPLLNSRYQIKQASMNHPMMKEILKKQKNTQEIRNFQKYLIQSNKVIFTFIALLIYVQTAIPSYDTKQTQSIDLLDLKNHSYDMIRLNEKTLQFMVKVLKLISSRYKKHPLWNHVVQFLEEYNVATIPEPKRQIEEITKHIISPRYPQFIDRIHYYIKYKSSFTGDYINDSWLTYRPSPFNKDIQSINDLIKRYEDPVLVKKRYGTPTLDNISMVRSLTESLQSLLSLQNIDILTNPAFSRLYKYSISKSGNYPKIPYLIHLSEQAFGKNDPMNELFTSNISFKKVRKQILIKIKQYQSNPQYSQSIKYISHIYFNNYSLLLLTTKPKRLNEYIPPNVYPTQSYADLKQDTKIVEKLFNSYCYDINGEIIKNKQRHTSPLSIDIDIANLQTNPCKQEIQTNESQFYKILQYIYNKTQLKPIYVVNPKEADTSISQTFNTSEQLRIYLEPYISSESISQQLYSQLIDESLTKDKYESILSNYMRETDEMIQDIYSFYIQTTSVTDQHKKKINKTLIVSTLTNLTDINHYSYELQFILSRIKNHKTRYEKGCKFLNVIPKEWKLSDRNNEIMEEYILNNEFLLHNQIFIPSKDKYNGFNRYLQEPEYASIFENLYTAVEIHFKNREKVSSDTRLFTKESVDIHKKYRFIKTIHVMIEFINQYDDTEIVELLSSFIVDFCIHIIQEWSDPIWIYTSQQELNQLLSSKKEREKQVLLNQLEMLSDEKRQLAVESQNLGISNWYGELESNKMEYIQSETYANDTEDLRREMMQSIQNKYSLESSTIGESRPGIMNIPMEETDQGYFNQTNFDEFDDDEGGDNLNQDNYDN